MYKWERNYKEIGNYSTGELLIRLGMEIKSYPKVVPGRYLDFIELQNKFNDDKITTEEFSETIKSFIREF